MEENKRIDIINKNRKIYIIKSTVSLEWGLFECSESVSFTLLKASHNLKTENGINFFIENF